MATVSTTTAPIWWTMERPSGAAKRRVMIPSSACSTTRPAVSTNSPRAGRGSLFAFDLQPGEAGERPAVGPHRTGGRRRDLAGTLVAVIDDEELILDAAQTLLVQWNCTVIAASSGHDALRQLADCPRPPDVLICDYRLRDDENGIGVVEAIRNEFNAEIPALLITGDTDPDEIRRITTSGLALLHKPLREDELHDAICALSKPPAPALRS